MEKSALPVLDLIFVFVLCIKCLRKRDERIFPLTKITKDS